MKKFKTLQELFKSEKRWAQNWFAYTKHGVKCQVDSRDAVRFCLNGGVTRVYGRTLKADVVRRRLYAACMDIASDSNFVTFNDDPKTTIKDIQALVKRAKV